MATSAALIPDVPDHVVAAIAAGLEGVVRPTLAALVAGVAALGLRVAGAGLRDAVARHAQAPARAPVRATRRWA